MIKRTFLFIVVGLLLTSCASPRPPQIPDTMSRMNVPVEESAAAVEPALPQEPFAGIDTTRTYSLTMKNVDIKDALLLLSRQAGATIITDKDVTGKVTVDFQEKSLKDILTAMLRPTGYTAYLEGTIIYVSRPQLVTRSFNINYIKDKRSSSSSMSASMMDTSSSSVNYQGGTGTPTTNSSTGQQGNVTVTTKGETDFWSELVGGLEVIVFGDTANGNERKRQGGFSKADRLGRKLVVNELSGLVFVTDFSDNMTYVRSYLEDVEKAAKRQVLIQAHIVEVALNDSFSFGIDWNYLRTRAGSDPTTIKLAQGLMPLASQTGVFQFSLTNDKVSSLLDAMKEQGTLNTLSSPKISTLNNQRALIKLTTKEVSWYTRTTTYPGPPLVNVIDNVPQIDEVGIFLDVTPQINDKGTISMQIHPSVSEVIGQSTSLDGKNSKPVIDIREVDTMIDVKNGQTVVIAGLISDKINETRRSVPWLGDIPYIGALFRFTFQEKKKTELVMLLTPYILTDKTIEEVRKEHEERLKKAGRSFTPIPMPVQ
jgi:MSHA biogenesis protein MshL